MLRFGMHWSRLDEARDNLLSTRFSKGLERLARLEPPVRTKVYPSPFREMRLAARPEAIAWSEVQLFWACLVVCGGRPGNLAVAVVHSADLEGVNIRWRLRKGGRNQLRGFTRYLFVWSASPSPSLIQALNDLAAAYRVRHPGADDASREVESEGDFWPSLRSSTAANRVWRWLRDREASHDFVAEWTSTTPRDVLSTRLLKRVDAGELSPQRFEWLMDHTVATARAHYVAGS